MEGDYSAACYPAAAAALTGGEVILDGLSPDSQQGDREFMDLLAEMGAEIFWKGSDLRIRGGATLRGIKADLSGMPDQVPTLAALAPFAEGETLIHNVAHLRIKESDRLEAMATELKKLGADAREGRDSLWHPRPLGGAEPPARDRAHRPPRRPPHRHELRPGRAAPPGRGDRPSRRWWRSRTRGSGGIF